MKKIVQVANKLNFKDLVEAFQNNGYEVEAQPENTNLMRVKKDAQSVIIKRFPGDLVFELEVKIPYHWDLLLLFVGLVFCSLDYLYNLKISGTILLLSFVVNKWLDKFKERKYVLKAQSYMDEIGAVLKSQ